MRAAVMRPEGMVVADIETPVPGPGQVLVRTLACGICGSDLHAAEDMARFVELTRRVGVMDGLEPGHDVVLGHEFCAEVVDYPPATERALPAGTRVCSVPTVLGPAGLEAVGYSNRFPGGLAELMVLQEMLLVPVPEGLPPEHAALTEPLAVGEHAVGLAGVSGDEVCVVIGCGPVGLAVVAALKARGAGPVVAADFSPARRALAERLGADVVVDPAAESPYARWAEFGVPGTVVERAVYELAGGPVRDAVIFEAVGVPGVLQAIVDGAPPKARVVVVGVCMTPDRLEPFVASAKELQVRFAFGYTVDEFAATLQRLGQGDLPAAELVTGIVPVEEAASAFAALRDPAAHGKILVRHGAR